MRRKAKIIFSRSNRKYFYSEIAAYLTAIGASSVSAHAALKYTDSDLIITLFSALIGTAGFLIVAIGMYTTLNLGCYYRKERSMPDDISKISRSYFESLLATYAVRIPLQFILQKMGMAPAAAAPISQTIAGQVGNIVRFYGNYKRKLFGHRQSPVRNEAAVAESGEGQV